jgi:phage terminase large subunit-like protein
MPTSGAGTPRKNDARSAKRYIKSVTDGKTLACKWVKLFCRRHAQDLKTAHRRGLRFDEDAACDVLRFFDFLHHSKGEWAGRQFVLAPWEQAYLWVLFGWKRKNGNRRFRTSYLEVARKNGKSTLAAGVALYLLDADGEDGAEVYSAATKRDQAKIVHGEAARMVRSSAPLKKYLTVHRDTIHALDTNSKFEPLSSDFNSLDGLNIHGAIVDEVHAHKTRDLWDILETATGARRQPLMFAITTAGVSRESVCRELHDYTEKILEGSLKDDSFCGIIYTLDEGDDWTDERVWIKANPNLKESVKLDDLKDKARKAKEAPSALNAFLRLHMNMWTQGETRWIDPDVWNACNGRTDIEFLKNEPCYGGLDLSSTTDITAFVLKFPNTGDVLPWFWIPEDEMEKRERRDRVPFSSWVRMGFVEATPGNVIDYDWHSFEHMCIAAIYVHT